MKKVLFGIMALAILMIACRKDDDSPAPAKGGGFGNTPLAKAEYDHSNYGIYKGVFVGSSGSILINVFNDGTLSAVFVIDGTTYHFSSTDNVAQGQAGNIHFTSGTNSFDFLIDAVGSFTAINFNIEGHPNPSVHIFKELSDALVKVYEGTFEGGIFNLIIRVDGGMEGAAKPTGQNAFLLAGAAQTNGSVTGYFSDNDGDNGTFTGTISGDNISGTWTQPDQNGQWQGHRTL